MTTTASTHGTSLAAQLPSLCRDRDIPEGRARRLLGIVVVARSWPTPASASSRTATNLAGPVGTARTRDDRDPDTASWVTLNVVLRPARGIAEETAGMGAPAVTGGSWIRHCELIAKAAALAQRSSPPTDPTAATASGSTR